MWKYRCTWVHPGRGQSQRSRRFTLALTRGFFNVPDSLNNVRCFNLTGVVRVGLTSRSLKSPHLSLGGNEVPIEIIVGAFVSFEGLMFPLEDGFRSGLVQEG